MTTVTDDALDWYQDRARGETDGKIDTIAVGSGTDSESDDADGLDDEEYRGDASDNNIEFIDLDEPGEMEAVIRVKGGTEVPGGTEISEMMVYVEDDEVVICVDNFSGVPVEEGHTEEFTIPFNITR